MSNEAQVTPEVEIKAQARANALATELAAAGMKRGTRLIDKIRGVLLKEFPEIEQWKRVNIACNADQSIASTRKPFSKFAGYVASLRSAGKPGAAKRGWVVIYEAGPAGLDTSAGKFVVICEAHGQTTYNASLKQSRPEMKDPTTFCIYCRYEAGEGPKPDNYDEVLADQAQVKEGRGF